MPGPPKTPTNLTLLRGNPGKRPINKNEPQPEAKRPRMPRWLGGKAKWAWKELVPLLEDMRVLTVADKKALELLCDAYQTYRDARQVVIEEGSVYSYVNREGDEIFKIRPEVHIAQESWKMVRQMLQEFGLTPAARTKVSVKELKETDPGEEFFGSRSSG